MAVVGTRLLLLPLALWFSAACMVGGNQEAMWPGAASILNVTNADLSKGVDYLMKFGYLKQDDRKMRTGEELREAIMTMQRFGGLDETGQLDADTLQLMQTPRCGVADIIGTAETTRKKRYALVGYYWQKKNLTYRIVRTTPQLSPYVVHDAIRRAFNVWSDVTPLTFTEKFHGEADIMIDFLWGFHGDGNPFDGPGNTLAHAFFPGPRRGGDTHFDEEEKWTMTKEGANLFQVATHEFGHALGLGHSSEHNTIMGPFYRYRDPLQLTEDDIRGIQQLYGAPEERRPKQPLTPVATQKPNFQPNHPEHVPNTPERPPQRPPVHTPDRRPHTPNHPATPPDTCFPSIDAVAVIRSELFVFKDRHFYRYHDKGLYPGYPAMTSRFWRSLPRGTHVDAVYERYDGKIVFFKGAQYWVFDGNYLESSYPRPIRDYGLHVQSVDAAFVWGHNGKTYFFKGNRYWRYDDIEKKMDRGYPKNIDRWEGVPNNLDGIMQWTDGLTYFFKGTKYWRFNDITMRVEEGYPRSAPHDWFGCRKVLGTPNDRDPEVEDPFSGEEPNDQPSASGGNHLAILNMYTALFSIVISVSVRLL